MEKIISFIIKISVWVIAFLIPLIFLPATAEFLDFNKQAVLILFSFIALFAWMIKALISGKFSLNKNKLHIFASVLFVALLLSAVFSIDRYGSFWG